MLREAPRVPPAGPPAGPVPGRLREAAGRPARTGRVMPREAPHKARRGGFRVLIGQDIFPVYIYITVNNI